MIVDAEKGLAVISRSVIPFDLGVLSLTFAESIIIPGKVFSVTIVLSVGGVSASYPGNRSYLMEPQITRKYPCPISPTCKGLCQARYLKVLIALNGGAEVTFVGFNHSQRIVTIKTNIVDVTDITVRHFLLCLTSRFHNLRFHVIGVRKSL